MGTDFLTRLQNIGNKSKHRKMKLYQPEKPLHSTGNSHHSEDKINICKLYIL
jgi:hypothetical protein